MKNPFGFFRRSNSSSNDSVTCAPSLEGLLLQLDQPDGVTRERARRSLVALGGPAVEPLLKALKSKKSRVRFEAAMSLRDIADRRAIPGLVDALGDRTFEVRWVAAEALINIGRPVVPAVLHALMENSQSTWLRDGCRHVLSHFSGLDLRAAYHVEHHPAWVDFDLRDVLTPVMKALEQPGAASRAPVVAVKALESFPATSAPRVDRVVIPH
ncbi:MAG: HEAT repeat domain-containing protein [Dehalococcoidia bacterium]|nr:HEAT repeat domain-containing protein [Dehalococcoidia bacterium]